MFKEPEEIMKVLPKIEAALLPLGAKPHYGKMFKLSGQFFEEAYGKDLLKLRELILKHDP